IAPDGPADEAGIKKRADGGLAGVGAAAQALLGPLGMALIPLQERAELARSGDLIVKIDDVRIRGDKEFRHELDKLKPGDSAYLTMLRALPSGAHQTIKVAIKVGELQRGECVKAPPTESAAAPPPPSRPGAESLAD
ncbi:MAG: PDZ domain-containing protein, partial [Candidatus Binataceae bacterium]